MINLSNTNINMNNNIQLTLRRYEKLLFELNREYKMAEDVLDVQEMIKISYHINTVTEAYNSLRANSDGFYFRSVMFREELNNYLANNDVVGVLNIAKKLGYTQKKICEDLELNEGNVSAYKKGALNRLSKRNIEKIFIYVFNLVNGGFYEIKKEFSK